MGGKDPKRITLEEKLQVQYCIPNWLRDEQIKVNIKKVKGRVAARYDLRNEPIALVNFGPSLKDTWEEIKKFKNVMTCSGAHKFCVEHGIIPTFHIDVDPRVHKIKLIGEPHKGTEYMIASTCHPDLFQFLLDAQCDVKLWHIFDTDADGMRLLPHGEWALTGGCSVGVRTITMARFLGFTDLHIFGMDGCVREENTHAAEHPNSKKKTYELDYEGKIFKTSPAMLEAAKNTWHELDMMKDVKTTFYGDGLVQAMSKKYVRKVEERPCFIAFNKHELISTEYCELNRRLHVDNLAYGVGAGKHAETVKKLATRLITDENKFVSVLDYGCGKGYLQKALPFPIYEYDPAIEGKDQSPRPADLVCCFDVLEHIEPDRLDFVLADILRCTKQLVYFIIYTEPSQKTLADGRNSHLIVATKDWWVDRLKKYFVIPDKGIVDNKPKLHISGVPRPSSITAMGNKLRAA